MMVGTVSDERYLAIAGALVEFEGPGALSVEARSRASGAVYADLPPGEYTVTLAHPGYGSKRVHLSLTDASPPHHFRLLPDTLLGYAWPKWVRGGEQAEFRVHSVVAYKLALWRYGARKELVRTLGWYDEHGPRATMQITPDGDYTQTGVAWNKQGYANPHHRQLVTAPERSGLYYFHAETAAGAFFSFPWVVAPAQARAKLAVLASNITWNAYNNFGGRSNYVHPASLPAQPTVNARQELKRYNDPEHTVYDTNEYAPLSFERPEPINHIDAAEQPTDPIEGRAACHVAPAEWRLLAWLEREHFAYDYYAETQLHDGTLDLDQYRVLVLSTHPEYWSRAMYEKVKSWVFDRGGRLVYLGGNGLNCEVEFVDPYTVIYKNGTKRELDDRRLESRFHLYGESEASLLGVVYDDRGIMTGAPYRVVDAGHWVFAGTGLANGDLFGRESQHRRCPGGASAHETDKISASSPAGTHLLAKGTNPDNGGAEIVYYETPSGGAVFSAGSIAWPSALLVDEGVSMITANVLQRMLA